MDSLFGIPPDASLVLYFGSRKDLTGFYQSSYQEAAVHGGTLFGWKARHVRPDDQLHHPHSLLNLLALIISVKRIDVPNGHKAFDVTSVTKAVLVEGKNTNQVLEDIKKLQLKGKELSKEAVSI